MPCLTLVFCDAEVDWFVVALAPIRALLLLPLTPTFDSTPVAALGATICVGFVCEDWLASVRWLAVCAPAALLNAAKTAAAMTDRDLFLIMDVSPQKKDLHPGRCTSRAGDVAKCYRSPERVEL